MGRKLILCNGTKEFFNGTLREPTAFYSTFVTATDDNAKSCTLSLYFLLKVSTLRLKINYVSRFDI